MYKRIVSMVVLFLSFSTYAQTNGDSFDQVSPDFKVSNNTTSFYDGECVAYLVRYSELYPDLHKKRESQYIKADFAWISKQQSRSNNLTNEYLVGNNNVIAALKQMPKADAEFMWAYWATLTALTNKSRDQLELSMALGATCKKAKFPYFLR